MASEVSVKENLFGFLFIKTRKEMFPQDHGGRSPDQRDTQRTSDKLLSQQMTRPVASERRELSRMKRADGDSD